MEGRKGIIGLRVLCIVCISIALFTKFYCIELIPTSSMEKTINPPAIVILQYASSSTEFHRGDIVSFDDYNSGESYTKRIIGLPGDVVDIRKGKVYVNGKELKEDYVSSESNFSGLFCVPTNNYFMLGDNRANSFDSRYWSNPFVERKQITGKVVLSIYPKYKKFSEVFYEN